MKKTLVAELYFKLPKDWNEKAKLMFSTGKSDIQVICSLGISAIEHEALMSIQEYADVFRNGMALCENWWMDWAQENLENKDANNKIFQTMTNRFFKWDKKLDKNKENDLEKKNNSVHGEVEKFGKKYGLKAVK